MSRIENGISQVQFENYEMNSEVESSGLSEYSLIPTVQTERNSSQLLALKNPELFRVLSDSEIKSVNFVEQTHEAIDASLEAAQNMILSHFKNLLGQLPPSERNEFLANCDLPTQYKKNFPLFEAISQC